MSRLDSEFDRLAGVWRVFGKRWTVAILRDIGARGVARFGELKKAMEISGTMLSERLAELEREGLVAKSILPPRVEYALTASAQELLAILDGIGRRVAKQNLEVRLATQPTNSS